MKEHTEFTLNCYRKWELIRYIASLEKNINKVIDILKKYKTKDIDRALEILRKSNTL